MSFFILGEVERCFELLLDTNRIPEAALLSRTYLPSQISRAVTLWREDLKQVSERAAASLADPTDYPNLFPDLDWALKVEEVFKRNRNKVVSATEYLTAKGDLDLDLIALIKEKHASGPQKKMEVALEDELSVGEGGVHESAENLPSPTDDPSPNVETEANAILQNEFGNDEEDDW